MKKRPVLRRLLTLALALLLICAAVPQAFASEVGTPEETPSALARRIFEIVRKSAHMARKQT